jgi:hypothetical protein
MKLVYTNVPKILHPEAFAMSDRRNLSGRLGVFAAIWFVLGATQAIADVRNLYTVEGVPVDERAADELTAKSQGIEKAQQEALQGLIEKITLRDNYDQLPEVDQKTVQQTIRDYAVANEKFGGGRYLATLTVRFKRAAVRALLTQNKVPIAETVSRPVVVLPVYRAAGSVLLWDDPNPWFSAWANRPSPNGLLPLVVPLGNFSDIAVLSAEQALNGEEDRLSAIAEKYDAIGTLVTVAELDIDPRTGAPSIQVSMTRFGKADTGRVFVRSFAGTPDRGVDVLLKDAVEALIIRAEEDWKRDNLQSFSAQQRISIHVPLTSLKNWLTIRNRLGRVSPIIDLSLVRLSVSEALVDIRYSGGPDQLRRSMAQSDLDLEFAKEDSRYVLRLGR